jgi:hypothetical protein
MVINQYIEQAVDDVSWFDDHQRFRQNILQLLEKIKASESEIILKEIKDDYNFPAEELGDLHEKLNTLMLYAKDLNLVD